MCVQLLLGRRKVDFSHKLAKMSKLFGIKDFCFSKFVFCFVILFVSFSLMPLLNLSGQSELGAFFF